MIIAAIVIAVAAWIFFSNDARDFALPNASEAENSETVVVQDGEVIGTVQEVAEEYGIDEDSELLETIEGILNNSDVVEGGAHIATREILITDGVKHSVPLADIVGGGPPKDGIPSIDDPQFVSVNEAADFLTDEEPGIAFSLNGISRFYPYQILVWHEIVNDTFPATSSGQVGQRALITYCPLCLSGIVFDPMVQGERVEFGTSGRLWESNLVMYDRKTDSLWSQILGEAIVGDMTGTQLTILPSDITRFGEWKAVHPDGEVLSRDTGALRFYGDDPYGDYYTSPGTYFSVSAQDDRLFEKDFVLGIIIDGQAKAYYPPAIQEQGEIVDQFAGRTIVGQYEADLDVVRLYEQKENGELERINPVAGFWFSWVAAHPETALFK